jgi:hypothetical protein
MASGAHGEARQAIRLAAACLLVALVAGASDYAVGILLGGSASWRATQDPRERILWDSADHTSVVLIGDSAFCSYYVDSLSGTLWNRLGDRLGTAVFPGALNAAAPRDFLLMAKRVADVWPAGTTVLIDIHPARLFSPQAHALPPPPVYNNRFVRLGRLVDYPDDGAGPLARTERRLQVGLARWSFLARNYEWVTRYLDARLKGGPDWKKEPSGSRRWDSGDDFARNLFHLLGAELEAGAVRQTVPLGWIDAMHATLCDRGLRPVFVLTPLNMALLREYASPTSRVERMLLTSHAFLVQSLTARRYEFVDLFGAVESGGFADLQHTNAAGDDRVVERLAQWLRSPSGSRNRAR